MEGCLRYVGQSVEAQRVAIKPNTSFQRTRVRGGRGPGPLNSKR